MDYLFVYSDKCPHSNKLKKFSVFSKLNKLNIDIPNNLKNIPNYIDSVPVLIQKKNNNISIIKENNLLEWFKSNSSQQSINNSNNSNNSDDNVLEANMLDNSFSSNYTFLDGNNSNILENNYSSLLDDSNISNTQNNSDININTTSEKKKTLDNDYEKLLSQRNNEFKSIERV